MTKQERRANRTGTIVFFTIVAASLLLVLSLPQFYVSSIKITGQRVVTEEQVLSTAGLSTGPHLFQGVNGSLKDLFQLRHKKAEEMLLENLPYIKAVKIRSVFPSVLSVVLEERVEVAYIAISDGCVIIDSEGVALEVLASRGSDGIPVIEGVAALEMRLGSVIAVDLPDALSDAIVLLNDIINADRDTRSDTRLLPAVLSIRPLQDDILYMTIQLPGTGEELIVKVKNSDANAENMIWLRFAMEQGQLEGKGKGVLDMTSSQKVFRPES